MYSLLLMLVCVFALTACGEEQIINNWDTSMMMFTPERVIAFVMEPETLGFIVTEESVDEAKHHYRQVMDDESPQMLAMLAGWESYQGSIE